MRLSTLLLGLWLAAALRGCVVYDYDHEFWLRTDGSGSVSVTGRPELWAAFKGLGDASDLGGTVTPDTARRLFERSGLTVRRALVTQRAGQPYLTVRADFADVNRLDKTPAFPDLELSLARESGRLKLAGVWRSSGPRPSGVTVDSELQLAVRFHLPSKVYVHDNAAEGVERGNIVSWRQTVAAGLVGLPLPFGAVMDERSILGSTVTLFGSAIFLALGLIALAVALARRRGRRQARAGAV